MRTFTVGLVLVLALPGSARADQNDLVLSRLGDISASGTDVIPRNQDFRSLISELGVVIAPRPMTPADTLGFSGFQFSTELAITGISSENGYWCATEESSACAPGFGKSGSVTTVGVFVRKGFWFPLPSFELGAGAVHVGNSRMWAGQVYAKFALHEGYHDWPLPSVSIRGAAARLMGNEQVDLTVVSTELSVSKRFAVAGTFSVAPYLGWSVLWIIPRSQVIDKTPTIAVRDNPMDIRMNFVFPDQNTIVRHRLHVGAKLKYYIFSLTAELDYALAGGSVDDRAGTDLACDAATPAQQGSCDAADKSGGQMTGSVAVSLEF